MSRGPSPDPLGLLQVGDTLKLTEYGLRAYRLQARRGRDKFTHTTRAKVAGFPRLPAHINVRIDYNRSARLSLRAYWEKVTEALPPAPTPPPPSDESTDQLCRYLHAAKAGLTVRDRRIAELERSIRWVLGEVDFDGWFGEGLDHQKKQLPFWWRTGLRQRAKLEAK